MLIFIGKIFEKNPPKNIRKQIDIQTKSIYNNLQKELLQKMFCKVF
ncbi:hypothetical protein SAMN05421730_1002209 [Anaerobium acetethylicum]|uniref:Uncharacterized protein n=1 Tax=Anaerobium acetethylicum TaxID=1619234 RepID=A0A1D3TQF9_9FIRM|nr:hypothetical protein SAMN05421730_1002209 [Anaerobium acetethylicum]